MKRILLTLCVLTILLAGCSATPTATIVATTRPVYEFTVRLCRGTDLTVAQIVTENVSCLHDYTLKVDQMQTIESAELIIINGAGLESFMEDSLHGANNIVDSSHGISLSTPEGHTEEEGHHHDHGHDHGQDPHIWLSPIHAKTMATNICAALTRQYPDYADQFQKNLESLCADLDALYTYGCDALSSLSDREFITFHDGFHYLAEAFDLTILRAIEEESGSEASAAELIELITEVRHHQLPAIFTEINGASSAAQIIANETGVSIYTLDMAMSGGSYFDAMYHNINTLREALQ